MTQSETPILNPQTEAIYCPHCREEIALRPLAPEPPSANYKEIVKECVLQHYGYTFEEINVLGRKRELVIARQTIMYFLKKKTPMSLESIGEVFGRDQTTVMNAIETIEDLVSFDGKVRVRIAAIEKVIDYKIEQSKI